MVLRRCEPPLKLSVLRYRPLPRAGVPIQGVLVLRTPIEGVDSLGTKKDICGVSIFFKNAFPGGHDPPKLRNKERIDSSLHSYYSRSGV